MGEKMNKTGIYLTALATSLVVGCNTQSSTEVIYKNLPEAQGRDVEITGPSQASPSLQLRIGKYNGHGFGGSAFIYAIDRDGDKTFDEIRLHDAENDSSIIDLANIKTLDELLAKLTGPNAPKPSKQ